MYIAAATHCRLTLDLQSLFSPRVIDFEKKELLRKARPSLFSQEVDDLYSLGSDITVWPLYS